MANPDINSPEYKAILASFGPVLNFISSNRLGNPAQFLSRIYDSALDVYNRLGIQGVNSLVGAIMPYSTDLLNKGMDVFVKDFEGVYNQRFKTATADPGSGAPGSGSPPAPAPAPAPSPAPSPAPGGGVPVGGGLDQAYLNLETQKLATASELARRQMQSGLIDFLTGQMQNPFSIVPALQFYGGAGGGQTLAPNTALTASGGVGQPSPYGPLLDQLIQGFAQFVGGSPAAAGAGGFSGGGAPGGGIPPSRTGGSSPPVIGGATSTPYDLAFLHDRAGYLPGSPQYGRAGFIPGTPPTQPGFDLQAAINQLTQRRSLEGAGEQGRNISEAQSDLDRLLQRLQTDLNPSLTPDVLAARRAHLETGIRNSRNRLAMLSGEITPDQFRQIMSAGGSASSTAPGGLDQYLNSLFPNQPLLAHGGYVYPGEKAIVGEAGPEQITQTGRRAQVTPLYPTSTTLTNNNQETIFGEQKSPPVAKTNRVLDVTRQKIGLAPSANAPSARQPLAANAPSDGSTTGQQSSQFGQYVANAARLLASSVANNPFVSQSAKDKLLAGLVPGVNEFNPAFWQYTSPVVIQALKGLYSSVAVPEANVNFLAGQFRPTGVY